MTHRRYRHSRRKRHSKSKSKSRSTSMYSPISQMKTTSKKYMPKLQSGIENVGDRVVKTSEKTLPFLQRMTRKMFGLFSNTRKRRH